MTTLALIITIVLAAFVWAFWVLRPRSRNRMRVKRKQVRQMRVPYYY
ncbi:MAG: hypothetical protein ACO1TE_24315 [Prosthecobacter sp.]